MLQISIPEATPYRSRRAAMLPICQPAYGYPCKMDRGTPRFQRRPPAGESASRGRISGISHPAWHDDLMSTVLYVRG